VSTTLRASYRQCRRLNRRAGTTYYAATWLLPAAKRRHVHALYGFCRHADDIVDDVTAAGVEQRRAILAAYADRFFADLHAGDSDDVILKAVVHTALTYGIGAAAFRRFLRSMEMDLSVSSYRTFDDLMGYMDGSAAVIGEMMIPILAGAPDDELVAAGRDLGVAFQLTNFLRDVGEDLNRGRVYLPGDEVERFGARPSLEGRAVTPEWVALMRFQVERARHYYKAAAAGIDRLGPREARCVGAAHDLYGRILEGIEGAGYDVFSARVRIPTVTKVAVAARSRNWRGTTGHSMP
jgi:phytoene synthase